MQARKYFLPIVVSLMVAVLVGGLVSSYILVRAPESYAVQVDPVREERSQQLVPTWLIIPSLGLKAAVQHVGQTSAGLMATPSNFTDVGWYRDGPTPGQQGSAVFAGHVDNALGLDGVFKHLERLTPGQEVHVQSASGDTLRFRVTNSTEYLYTEVPTAVFTDQTGKYIRLITCAGVWLPKQKTYDTRLVVYAVLVQ